MADTQNIEVILERQAAFWEVRRRLTKEGGETARESLVHLREGPWLTVSKQLGSGGIELARAVGRALGWQVYDREILATIARHTDRRETILSQLDEHAVSSFDDYLAQLVIPGAMSRIGYLQEMLRVVWGVARQGGAVILGRGANWILTPAYGLRLRTVAPLDARIRRMMTHEALSENAAAASIKRHDSEQSAFIRQTFGRDIEDPLGYDLVLNTADVPPETAVEIVSAALRHKLLESGGHGSPTRP